MVDRTLEGRTALVTGGGRGIGAAIAGALAGRGSAVAIHGRAAPEAVAADLSRQYGVATAALAADLSLPGSADALFAGFDAAFGTIDILINNAGYETTGAAEDLAETDWRGVIEVNLTAPFLLAQHAARRMKGRGGVIINISSIHATVPRKGLTHYATAKAGLAMMTKNLALEWAEYGIRVIEVAPGAIETDMNREALDAFGRNHFEEWIPAGRIGGAADVSEAVAFLCSDAASYITGTSLLIDGGYALNLVRYDDRSGRK